MDLFAITSIVVVISAIFGYVNVRFIKLPKTIGLMLIAIIATCLVFATAWFDPRILGAARTLIGYIDFQEVLLDVMLGFLLFAGALHTNFDQLRVQRWPILIFSTVGVVVSTFLVGAASYYVFGALGLQVQFIHCLLFGALISPTDPIAVLGILKAAGVPKKLEAKIVGESLFNDGVGVVVFLTIFSIATGGQQPHRSTTPLESAVAADIDDAAESGSAEAAQEHAAPPDHSPPQETTLRSVATLFGVEVCGGVLLGLQLGTVTFYAMRSIDDYEIEVIITLACVMGGYSLASHLHLSAPLAIVVAGLIVGNDTARGSAMSDQTEDYVDRFWEMVDMLMNAVLFVLIGLELLILRVELVYVYAALAAILFVLAARFISLVAPVKLFSRRLDFVPHSLTIMTWGGLRGGISIALALQMNADMNRDLFVTVTYGVVIFSIIVQGLSVGPLAGRLIGNAKQVAQ